MVRYVGNIAEILDYPKDAVEKIASIARISHGGKQKSSDEQLIKKLIEWGHDSVLEHGGIITVQLVVSRGCANQLVRHRLASFLQESTRYVTYDDLFIIGEENPVYEIIEKEYKKILKLKGNDYAKYLLPQATATTLIISANIREWRHILKLRTDKHAHFEVRNVMTTILNKFKIEDEVLWGDI